MSARRRCSSRSRTDGVAASDTQEARRAPRDSTRGGGRDTAWSCSVCGGGGSGACRPAMDCSGLRPAAAPCRCPQAAASPWRARREQAAAGLRACAEAGGEPTHHAEHCSAGRATCLSMMRTHSFLALVDGEHALPSMR
eukprot:1752929-Prymnesium_polylepis.1